MKNKRTADRLSSKLPDTSQLIFSGSIITKLNYLTLHFFHNFASQQNVHSLIAASVILGEILAMRKSYVTL